MTDFPDYQEPQANATALAGTSLTGTGLAKETGGNLDTHTKLLSGTQAGALVGVIGNTVAKEVAAFLAGGAVGATPGGVPLLHGATSVYNIASQVIAVNGTFSTGNIAIAKPGYLIRVVAQMSAAGAAAPSLKADLTWTVTGTGTTITAEEHWWLPAGGTVTQRTTGRGPTKGDTLNIKFTNGDAADTCTISVTVWETTQHMARDDWRSASSVSSAIGTAANNDALGNILANESVSVNAGVSATRNLPLYAGQANMWINQNVATGSFVQIVPVGAFDLGAQNPVARLDWTGPPQNLIGVILPRCWCQVIAFNNAAGAVTFSYAVTALEYAS